VSGTRPDGPLTLVPTALEVPWRALGLGHLLGEQGRYEGLILPIAALPAPPKTPTTASGAYTSTTLSVAGPLPPLGTF
jgi:hypothetical protein